MSRTLKRVAALALISLPGAVFAAENPINMTECPSNITQHMDNYYGCAVRTENAVHGDEPIPLTDNGIAGKILQKENHAVVAAYDCTIDPASLNSELVRAIIRGYEVAGEKKVLLFEFLTATQQLLHAYFLDVDSLPADWHEENELWGDRAPWVEMSANDYEALTFPTWQKLGVGTLLGVPHNDPDAEDKLVDYSITPDGKLVQNHLTTVFSYLKNIDNQAQNINQSIADQQEDLANTVVASVSTRLDVFNTTFQNSFQDITNASSDRTQVHLEKNLHNTVNILTNNLHQQASEDQENLQNELKKTGNALTETIRAQSSKLSFFVKGELAEQTKNIEQHTKSELERVTGVGANGCNLTEQLTHIHNTHRQCDELNSQVQNLTLTYRGYAPFYADHIMALLDGEFSEENNPGASFTTVWHYTNKAVQDLVGMHVQGLPSPHPQIPRLERIRAILEHLQEFFKLHELSTQPKLLGLLAKVFGPALPPSESTGDALYNYCQTAHFTTADYGLYGWVRDISDYIADWAAKTPDEIALINNSQINKFNADLEGFLNGQIAEESIGSAFTYRYLIPPHMYHGVRDYPTILEHVDSLVERLEARSFHHQIAEMEQNLSNQTTALQEDLTKRITALATSTNRLLDLARFEIYRLFYIDVDGPHSKLVADTIRLLNGAKQSEFTKEELETLEAFHIFRTPHVHDQHAPHGGGCGAHGGIHHSTRA